VLIACLYCSPIGNQPGRLTSAATPWVLVAMGVAGVVCGLALARASLPGSIITISFSGLPLMFGVGQIRMSRAVRRLSGHRVEAGPRPARTRTADWSPPPPLHVREVTVADVPSVPIPDGIAILFLWVFDRTVTGSLLHRLNRIGPVYFLLGGGILAYDLTRVPKMAFGRIDRMIEETEEEVMQRLQSFRVSRRLGYYSILTMACTDGVWTFALDRMLERCRVVVVDLSDFVVGRSGIAYEIALLLDRVPLDRVVFVCGPETDRNGLSDLMRSAWDTLAPSSPNRRCERALATMAITTALVEDSGARPDAFSATTRAEREFIAALVAEAAAEKPPSPLPPPRRLPPPRPS
jgi:hypothetical protein